MQRGETVSNPGGEKNDWKTDCVLKMQNYIYHSVQIPFPSGCNTVSEVFVEKQSKRVRRRQPEKDFCLLAEGGGGKHQKNPWNLCEELEGYTHSCYSNKLDHSFLTTSFPALFQPRSLQTYTGGAGEAEGQQGHSAAGFAKRVRVTITH